MPQPNYLPLFLFFTIISLSIATFINSETPSYSPCPANEHCGNGLIIKYPFWIIPKTKDKICGYDGFGLSCKNNRPVLTINEFSFYVKEIDYSNQTLLVIDLNIEKDLSCPIPSKESIPFPYELQPAAENLLLQFFFNCTISSYPVKPISCLADGNRSSFVLKPEEASNLCFPEAERKKFWAGICAEQCEKSVTAYALPTESLNQSSSTRGWENGFKLDWLRPDYCSPCESLGGFCGFASYGNTTHICICKYGGACNNYDRRNTIPGCSKFECNGSRTFQYPFWFDGPGSKYCGYPGLGVSCDYGGVLSISGDKYYIEDVDYQKKKLTLVDVNLINSNSCVSSLTSFHTVKLESPSSLSYNNETFVATLFVNCTSFPNSTKPITCQGPGNSSIDSYLPVSEDFLHDTGYECEKLVTIPLLKKEAENLNGSGSIKALQAGFELSWSVDSTCRRCEASGGACGYYVGSAWNFTCFCRDGQNRPQHCYVLKGSPLKSRVLISVAVGTVAVIVVTLTFLNRRRLSSSIASFFWMKKYRNARTVEKFLENYGSFTPKRYKYLEIQKMTNFFKEKLGQGGYGSVFKGKLVDGRLVAVKVLNESKGNGEEFINEVASIGRTYHVNIVSLLGFCSEGSKRALVYEFMPNGSLERFIFSKRHRRKQVLSWETLYQIATGIAQGLDYLHRGCITRILHFDIKPHNILLDEKFCPKISDFGLSKLCPTIQSTISMPGTRGTIGYMAPEVFCRNIGGVSYKSDVYSYGMMVLEMVGGRKNLNPRVENTSEIYFPHWIYNRIGQEGDLGMGEFNDAGEEETARKMVLLGLWCIQTDPSIRPSMSRVLEMLEGSCSALQMPPKPYLDSASSA